MTDSIKKFSKNLLFPIILGLILSFIFRTFLAETDVVIGESMLPTFQDGDLVITDKISYLFSPPKRGDIVIVKIKEEDKKIIKRIIGLPGDTLYFEAPNENNHYQSSLYINGKPYYEPYINEEMTVPKNQTYKVPEGKYFVMGDNRNRSADSRIYGTFSLKDIEGKVALELTDDFKFYSNPIPYILFSLILLSLVLFYLFFPMKKGSKP